LKWSSATSSNTIPLGLLISSTRCYSLFALPVPAAEQRQHQPRAPVGELPRRA
jgi:hypothetical protein